MRYKTIRQYSCAVADYLTDEYGDMSKALSVNHVQSNVIGGIINYCFENEDSINNTANYLVDFLRQTNTDWSNK